MFPAWVRSIASLSQTFLNKVSGGTQNVAGSVIVSGTIQCGFFQLGQVSIDTNRIRLRGGNSGFYSPGTGRIEVVDAVVRMTGYPTASRPNAATVGAGALAFDSDLGKLIVSNGTAWEVVTSA